jgi:hypothetical protein
MNASRASFQSLLADQRMDMASSAQITAPGLVGQMGLVSLRRFVLTVSLLI